VNTATPTPPTDSYHLLTIYWTPTDMITNITSFKPDLTRKSNPIQLQAAQTYSTVKKNTQDVLRTIHNRHKMHKISDNTPTNKEQLLLYLKPTHALPLNTLSHPYFKTLKFLKNVL
jgi:hypothetical protein